MNFLYNEIQTELIELARRIIGDSTGNERQQQIEAQDLHFDSGLWQLLAQAGLLGIAIEEQYGGMGSDYETLCLLVEESGRGAAAIPVLPVLVGAALPLQQYGSEAQKKRFLPGIADGSSLVTGAWFEPDNFDSLNPDTRASREGDGWLLSGSKFCVPYGRQAQAILLAAATDDGIGLFLVDPTAPGVKLTDQSVTTGEPQVLLELEQVEVGADSVLVSGADGAAALEWVMQRCSAAVCAQALGVSEQMMQMTAGYTAEREQFGVKIGTFQAVSHRAANCFIDVQCLRLTTQQAISLLNDNVNAEVEMLVAKSWAGNTTHRVSYAAQHLHGGMGVDRDYGLFRYCLWAKQLELQCGGTRLSNSNLGDRLAERFSTAVGN